jgi:O-methyltransferase
MIYPTYSTLSVFHSTYNLAREVKCSGDIVECGVAAGSNFAQMIKASKDAGHKRKYYGFDSFVGIPWAGERDQTQPGIGVKDKSKHGLLESSGISSHSRQSCIDNLERWGVMDSDVILIEGWFQKTLPNNKIKDIAILRLDGDLYDSTKICLEYLYPKVQQGGLVIIDDYELKGCYDAVHDYFKDKNLTIDIIRVDYTAIWYKKN